MTFVVVRPWCLFIFKNSIFLDCNLQWGKAVVKVKSSPSLSEKRNTDKCRRKLAVANIAKTKAMHQHKLKLQAGTTTTRQQQNKQRNKNRRRDSCFFFLEGGGGGGRHIFRQLPFAENTCNLSNYIFD